MTPTVTHRMPRTKMFAEMTAPDWPHVGFCISAYEFVNEFGGNMLKMPRPDIEHAIYRDSTGALHVEKGLPSVWLLAQGWERIR